MKDKHLEKIALMASENKKFKKMAIDGFSKIPDPVEREKRLFELNTLIDEYSKNPPKKPIKDKILFGWVYPFLFLLYVVLGAYIFYKLQINPQISALILASPAIIHAVRLNLKRRLSSGRSDKNLETAMNKLKKLEEEANNNGI